MHSHLRRQNHRERRAVRRRQQFVRRRVSTPCINLSLAAIPTAKSSGALPALSTPLLTTLSAMKPAAWESTSEACNATTVTPIQATGAMPTAQSSKAGTAQLEMRPLHRPAPSRTRQEHLLSASNLQATSITPACTKLRNHSHPFLLLQSLATM